MIFKNKLRRKYMSEIKAFFPVITKNERKFLKIISNSVDEYCLDNPNTSIEDIYEQFGSPQETINSYIVTHSNFTSYMKHINIAKSIKRLILVIIAAFIFITAILFKNIQEEHKTFKDEAIYFREENIE